MASEGSVSFTYDADGKTEVGQISVRVHGIDLDDALNLLVDALGRSTDPAYTVTRAQVTETITRDKRGPSVRTGRVAGQTVAAPTRGEPRRAARGVVAPAGEVTTLLPGVLDG